MSWTPSSWRKFPIKQQPTYLDQKALKSIEDRLSKYPPLIFAGEARTLKEHLAKVGSRGGISTSGWGLCLRVSTISTQTPLKIYFNLCCSMNMVLMYSTGKPIITDR